MPITYRNALRFRAGEEGGFYFDMEEGKIVRVFNQYVVVKPSFSPMSMLEDVHGNMYLVLTSESSFDKDVARSVEVLEEEELRGMVLHADNESKAIIIGELKKMPKAGDRVRLRASFFELKSEDPVVTPLGAFDPWANRMSHVTIFAKTGSGKSVMAMYLMLLAIKKGYKIVVLDYHGEYREMYEDLLKMGIRAIYYDVPKVDICKAPPEALAAAFGIVQLLDKAPKMMHYMNRIAELACSSPQEIRSLFEDPVDLIRAITEAIILLPTLEKECATSRLDNSVPKICKVLNYIRSKYSGFEYNLLKDLVDKRDRDSLESLYRYSKTLDEFRGIITIGEDIQLEGYEAVFLNLSLAISHISYAEPIAIHAIRRVAQSPERIVLFVEEAPAFMQDVYIWRFIENLVRQGRKFDKFVVLITQSPFEIMSQTDMIIGNLANIRYIKEVLARTPHMSDALRYILPILPPWHFVYVSSTGLIMPVKILRKVARHSASEI